MLKAAQLSARSMGNATIRILRSIGIWEMTHKLALVQIYSVFFDGCLRCGCLMCGQILELIDVAIVSPSAFGVLAWIRPCHARELGSVVGSEFFDLSDFSSLEPA